MTIFTRTLSRRRRYLLMPRYGEAHPAVGHDDSSSDAEPPLDEEVLVEPEARPAFPSPAAREPLELLLTSPDGHGTERVRIDESTALVGRGRQADLRLPHPDVSRCHVLLRRVADRVVFADLCSRTGVKLNGQARKSGWLIAGDVLQLGPFSIRWPGEAPSNDEATHSDSMNRNSRGTADGEDDDWHSPVPSLWLHCTGGPDSVDRHIPLKRTATLVGRSPSCDLRLGEATLARVQIVVLSVPGGVVAVDLERRGRFAVNGIRGNEATVTAGDELHVGPYRLSLTDTATFSGRTDGGSCRVTVPTIRPSDLHRVAPSALPSEDAVRALVAALADLQRRFQERSRHQLELLPQLKDSASASLHGEIDAEIERLQAIVGEDVYDSIREKLQNVAPPNVSVVPTVRQQREATLRRAFGPRIEQPSDTAVPAEARQQPDPQEPAHHGESAHHEPPQPEGMVQDAVASGVEYARIACRIANQQRGRSSRTAGWGRVMRSIFLMG